MIPSDRRRSTAPIAAAALFAVSLAPVAQGAELDWSIGAGATYSDNVGRVATNEQSDTTGDVNLTLSYGKDEGRLQAGVGADLTYRSYFQDSYDDELIGRFDASAVYWFAPERFSWVVENNFSQTYIDRAAIETPANRQNTNYFSTGPDAFIRLGDRTQLSLQGRWSDVRYETSDNGNQQRLLGAVGLNRQISPRTSISLNGTAERVEFDDPTEDRGYDRQSAYLGFNTEGARTELSVQGGYTALHDFGETIDGPLFDLSLSRKVSARSALTLRLGTSLTDSADMFRRDYGIAYSEETRDSTTDGNEDVPFSTDTFQSDYISLGWGTATDRNSFGLSADWRREDYTRDKDQNRERLAISASFSRKMTRLLRASLFASWETNDYVNSDIDFDEWSFGGSVDWAFARQFSLGLSATRFEGSGGATTGSGVRDYTENRIALRINYYPGR